MNPDYERIQTILDQMSSTLSAAEAQGVLCGLLVIDQDSDISLWVREIVADFDVNNALFKEKLTELSAVYKWTVAGLEDEMFGFQLLLPEEAASLQSQTQALKQWLEGFLYGIALAQFDADRLSPEGNEILKDYTEITKIQTDDFINDAQNEAQMIEIVEYIRVTTLYLRQDIKAA